MIYPKLSQERLKTVKENLNHYHFTTITMATIKKEMQKITRVGKGMQTGKLHALLVGM